METSCFGPEAAEGFRAFAERRSPDWCLSRSASRGGFECGLLCASSNDVGDLPIECLFRDVRAARIGEGANDIRRLLIVRRLGNSLLLIRIGSSPLRDAWVQDKIDNSSVIRTSSMSW